MQKYNSLPLEKIEEIHPLSLLRKSLIPLLASKTSAK